MRAETTTYRKLLKNRKQRDFIVSISDSYVEWAYRIPIGSNHSISQVEAAICKRFKVKSSEAAIRTRLYKWRKVK